MKCYHHNNIDAVGTCSLCGKAACQDCIEDISGTMLCIDCMSSANRELAEHHEHFIAEAKRKIALAPVLTGIFAALFGLIFSFGMFLSITGFHGKEVAAIPWVIFMMILAYIFVVYEFWATFWGWQYIYPKWKELLGRMGGFIIATPSAWVNILLVLFIYIPLIGACVYGVFGGGFKQYKRFKKLVAEHSNATANIASPVGAARAESQSAYDKQSGISFAPRQSHIDEKPVGQKDGRDVSPIPVIVGLGDKSSGIAAKAKLDLIQDGQVKHEFLLSGDAMVIGRWDADGGVFPEIDLTQYDSDSYVSRKHARVSMTNNSFFIEDLGSANGTFVNRGGRIIPGKPEKLSNGCEIIIGKTFLKFHIL
jgi:hypothetical protein